MPQSTHSSPAGGTAKKPAVVTLAKVVPGASDAVLRGGRYDGLLARYGRPSPAVGFAVDVDAVAGVLESTDTPPRAAPQRSNEKPRRARSKE